MDTFFSANFSEFSINLTPFTFEPIAISCDKVTSSTLVKAISLATSSALASDVLCDFFRYIVIAGVAGDFLASTNSINLGRPKVTSLSLIPAK